MKLCAASLLACLGGVLALGPGPAAGPGRRVPIEVSVTASGMGRPAFDAGFRAAISRDFLALEPRWRQRYFDVVDSIPNPYLFATRMPGRKPIHVELEAVGGEPSVSARPGTLVRIEVADMAAMPATVRPNAERGTILVPGLPRLGATDPVPSEVHLLVRVHLSLGARRWWVPGDYRYSIWTRTRDEGAERRAGFALASLVLESLLRESRALSYERQLALGPGTSRDVEVKGDVGPVPLEGFLESMRQSRDWDGVFAVMAILAAVTALLLLLRRAGPD